MGARRCGTPVGLIAGLLAFLALAAPAQARDCETWNYDLEQRCLSQGDGARQGETVRVENAGDKVQTFSYQQWYSVCGQASGHPPSALNKVVLQPREVLTIQLPPHPGAKPGDGGTYCTELFIFDCNDGQQVCGVDLIAEIAPPATPVERACEGVTELRDAQSYDTIVNLRCLAQRAAARRGARVSLANISTGRVSFRIEEWHSVCGFAGRNASGSDSYHDLKVGETWSFTTWPNTEMHTLSQDRLNRCTEVFVRDCHLDDMPRACAMVLGARIAP